MDSFIYSKVTPNNSITNPSVDSTDYLDSNAPFSFIDFLKYTKSDSSPEQFNNLYINYIKEWNSAKKLIGTEANNVIKERYVELIKEITLKYTTFEEKRFLLHIDYNDPLDLDVVIPFYSKKIREVCDFYAEKRETLKYKIEKNKIKGTTNSIERSIYETITDTLFCDQIEVGQYQKIIDNKQLLKSLEIEVEELYDLYTNYLDNDPDEVSSTYDVNNSIRNELFTSNLNKIDANIFINIDKAIQQQIFDDVIVFLEEFGKAFTIDYDINAVDLNCKTGDPLAELVLATKGTASREVLLRNKLIKKYIGSDFYYISTGETVADYTFDRLLLADNPSGNLLNRHFPSTASVEENELASIRKIGLFFTPDKTGILYFSVPEKKYKVDTTKLEPNKLYIFPDPSIYGNTSGLSRKYDSNYPLIHVQDYTKSVKGLNYSKAEGDIQNNPFTQDFHGYFSKSQITNGAFGNEGLAGTMSSLANTGYLVKWASDIYGNEYGLFKSKSKRNFVDATVVDNSVKTIMTIYDGGPAMFHSGQFLPELVPSSSSSWVYPNIWSSYYYYNILIDGSVGGYVNGIMQRGLYESVVYDGGAIINDPSIDFNVNFNPLEYYTDDVIDGLNYSYQDPANIDYDINLVGNLDPNAGYVIDSNYYDRLKPSSFTEYQELDGNPTGNSSNFTPNGTNQYILSSIQYEVLDGGEGMFEVDEVYNFEETENFIVTQMLNTSSTVYSLSTTNDNNTVHDLTEIAGNIYVRNIVTNKIKSLSGHLSVQFDKYPSEIRNEIYNEVLDFGIFNDVMWLKTTNYIILEKIAFSIDSFVYSGTSNNYMTYKRDGSKSVSLPFFFENRNYGFISSVELSGTLSNSFYIIPRVYKFDYNTMELDSVYPSVIDTKFRNISADNPVKIVRANDVKTIYNSRNDKYGVVSVCEDQNEYPYIYKFVFDYNGSKVTEDKINLYTMTANSVVFTLNAHDENLIENEKLLYTNIQNSISAVDTELGALIFS